MTEVPPMKIRVIDLETTGFPEDPDAEIIEIGSVDLIGDTVSNHQSSLVICAGPIPPQAKAVHYIIERDLSDAPRLREVADLFFTDGLEPDDVFAAHNAAFEQHFIPEKSLAWVCTYKGARIVWPDAPTHSNQGLRYWLGLDNLPDFDRAHANLSHRALPDAYVTSFILRELLRHKTVAELVEISKWPALLKVMNFGKHRGTPFSDAPTDYLEWVRDKSDMDADTKFTARYWLSKRSKTGAQA